jgi:hypothetical protein
MARKVLRRQCGFGKQCPGIEFEEGGDVMITGYEPGTEQTPENERTIAVPPVVVPELVALDIPDFDAWLEGVRRTPGDIYRVQTLARYGAENEYVRRYLRGEPGPTGEELRPWGDELDADRSAGRAYRNLHVIRGPLTDELRMQFEWAYTYNVAHGQDVRIVDAAEIPAVAALQRTGDYWVVEREHVVLCRYDDEGRPQGTVGVEAAGAQGFIAAAEMAWALATPFTDWWAAHPQYHRARRQAA